MKIAFVGSAGTGRDIVARDVADRLGLKCLPNITQQILREEGFFGKDRIVTVEKFLAQNGRQQRLLSQKIDLEISEDGFIVPRSTADLAVYYLIEQHNIVDTSVVFDYVERCQKHMETYSHVFFFPRSPLEKIENNGIRTMNPWYQFIIHSIAKTLLDEWKVPYYEVIGEDRESKVEVVLSHLK